MSNHEATIQDVLEAVQGLSTHMDEEFANVRSEMVGGFAAVRGEMATKEDLKNLKSDLMTEIDRFVVLHQTLSIELVALRSRCERMENFMAKVAKQLNLDFQIT